MSECLFCRVAAHELPARILYEDEQCVAFQDIHPQAPAHLLVIPRKHIISLNDDLGNDKELLGHLLTIASRMAKEQGVTAPDIESSSTQTGKPANRCFHLHVHVLGGRMLGGLQDNYWEGPWQRKNPYKSSLISI